MNITLAEDRNGQLLPERSFSQTTISLGRDESCDMAFDKAQFPMVSRRHAEVRWNAGEWMLVDLGSSFGTFLNGRKMERPMPLPVGSAIQLGTDGPILKVIWYDVETESFQPPATAVPAPRSEARSEQQQPPSPPPQAPKPVEAVLHFTGTGARPPVRVAGQTVWLGRDPACEVMIEEGAGMVSRRHAEISPFGRGYKITDNNSFNGTLVNGQRITAPAELFDGDEIQLGIGGPVLRFTAPALTPVNRR
jgi:ABC transport system ATP-binding/permease protein